MKANGEVEDGRNEFSQLMNLLRLLQQANAQQQQQQQQPKPQPLAPAPTDTKLQTILPAANTESRSLTPAEMQQQQLQLLQQHLLQQQQQQNTRKINFYVIKAYADLFIFSSSTYNTQRITNEFTIPNARL